MKPRELTFTLLAFVAGLAIAFTEMLRDFDPKPTDPTISVTNEHFGVATFTVHGTGPSVNRMAAAIACVNGEIPWQLKPLSKLVDDKVAIIRKLEERVADLESRTRGLNMSAPGVITVTNFPVGLYNNSTNKYESLPLFNSPFKGTKVF